MAGENTPVRLLQGGSVLEVATAGSVSIASGGSIQVASGGVLNVASGGSYVNAGEQAVTGRTTIADGGSIQVASGGLINVAAGGSVRVPSGGFNAAGTVSIGGTVGRWAFGSATLTSGTAHVFTGLTQVVAAQATPVTGGINAGTGAGTATGFQLDLSRAANGTAIFLGVTGTSAFTGAGTITFQAFGF